jgi:hypothetical protein
MDPEAPSLSNWLGDATIGLDALMDRGEVEVIGGVSKYIINCNWKFAQDNSNDTYHGSITHAAARMLPGYMGPEYLAGRKRERTVEPRTRFTFLTEYGHTFVSSVLKPEGKWPRIHLETPEMEAWRNKLSAERPRTAEMQLNSLLLNLFPNAFVSSMTNNLELRIPRGPLQTEVWMWTFVDKNAPPSARAGFKYASEHHFGPGGIHEQDDGENWGESTNGTRGLASRRYPLNYSLNVGRGEIIEDEEGPPRIENSVNEHGQLWLYRKWAEMMDSPTWADYERTHARPTGSV